MDVLGGATLEVCVAQFWNQLGSHEVDVAVDFHGITPAGSQSARSPGGASGLGAAIAINGNYGVVRTDFSAAVRPEYGVRPKATLDVLRMALRPLSAAVAPCASERDIHPASGVAIHRLVLDYALETKSDGATIRPRLPALDSKIYESWADDFALAIFDANKRRVASQISYTASVTLRRRGSYLVRVQIRHRNEKDLEALRAAPLLVDMQLAAKISVPTFPTLAAAFTGTVVGSRPTASGGIARGATMPLFFRTELTGVPPEAAPGDVLCGSLSLSAQTAELPIEYVVPARARAAEKPEPAGGGGADSEASLTPAEKDRSALDEAMRSLRIAWIRKAKDDGVREQLVSDLLASDVLAGGAPEDGGDDGGREERRRDADNDFRAAVLSAQLDALDPARRTHLPWSDGAKLTAEAARSAVGVADRIVELTYPLALTARLHQNQNHQAAGVSDADRRRRKLAEAARDRLVGALTAKCRALAFLTTQPTASSRSSETSVDFIDVVSASEDGGEKSGGGGGGGGSHWLADYEKTVSDLTRWTGEKQQDEDAQFLVATLPLLVAKQCHGRALLSALRWIDRAPLLESNAAERTAMVELRDLLVSQLGWSVWADHLRDLALVERPPSYEAL
ncbi:hypothetical protein H4217_008874 [Coemansia sp. RSA 1939]|nr:hypothetical protein H4217_008874 [Coemansia sp. RSA 1939]